MKSTSLTGAEALVKSLERQGVEYIFGYSGGAAIPIFDALMTSGTKIKLILTRHEQGATHMADEAFAIAATGRPGPVLIDVPKDVSSSNFTGSLEKIPVPNTTSRQIPAPSKTGVAKVAALLADAKRPVILAGHGVLIAHAETELRTASEQFDIPVVTTLLGKGAIDETLGLSLGMLGMHGTAYANKAVLEADVIVNIGSRFDDRITGDVRSFGEHATIVHVDIDAAELGKMIRPDIAVQTDARTFLQALLATGKTTRHAMWRKHLKTYRQAFPLSYDDSSGLTQQHVLDEIWQQTCGDGGFQMTLYELATAALYKLPIKIFVLNNHYLGMVRQWQELFYDNRLSGVDMEGNPDFVQLTESYGICGINIEKSGEVEARIAEALAYQDGPVLVNCEVAKTDNVYPMIPAGRGYRDMLVSAPTTKLEKPTGST